MYQASQFKQRPLQTSIGGITFKNESQFKGKQSQYSFNKSKSKSRDFQEIVGEPSKLKAFSLYPFSDNDRIQKTEAPEHVVFHVRGRSSQQMADLWRCGLGCGIVLVIFVILGICFWAGQHSRPETIERERKEVFVQPTVDTKIVTKVNQEKVVAMSPKVEENNTIVQPIVDENKKAVVDEKIDSKKVVSLIPPPKHTRPPPKIIAKPVQPLPEQQPTATDTQSDKDSDPVLNKSAKQKIEQFKATKPIIQSPPPKQPKTTIKIVQPLLIAKLPERVPHSNINLISKKQSSTKNTSQASSLTDAQKLSNMEKQIVQKLSSTAPPSPPPSSSIIKHNDSYFQCRPPAFIYKSSCIKCPQNSTWNGSQCVVNTFPFKISQLSK